jgi:Tfp pilus assembly protein PilN
MSEPVMNTSPLEINLLQWDEDASLETESLGKPLLVLAVLLVGICVVGWLWNDARVRSRELQAELDAVNAKINELEARRAETGLSMPVQTWLALPEALRTAVPETTAMLDSLRALLPEEANLTSVVYTEDGNLKVSGRFASVEHVIAFMREVQESGNFELVNMSGLSNTLPRDGTEGGAESGAAGPKTLPVIAVSFDLRYAPSSPE